MAVKALPLPLQRALRKLGADICDARRRRRIPTALMAERCSMTRVTLSKIEKGDPTVSFQGYAMVLFVLGLTERLASLVDPSTDSVGLALEREALPERIHTPKMRFE